MPRTVEGALRGERSRVDSCETTNEAPLVSRAPKAGRRQGIFWIGTIPYHEFTPFLPPGIVWIKGQLECGEEGYLHWQFVLATHGKKSLGWLRELLGTFHFELTFSARANDYVDKDRTAIAGTRFELGAKPIRLNCTVDWEQVWERAQSGDYMAIPPSYELKVFAPYNKLRVVFNQLAQWFEQFGVSGGPTGTGKSRRAWDEAGTDAYPKSPSSKFWDGYQGEKNVIIDEFRGKIGIEHLLRWFDRYPVRVEIKGSSLPEDAECFWICSNLSPRDWYPDVDYQTVDALFRRMEVIEFV